MCHYWYGHMLLIALYGFNTYSLLTHGIIYIITAICILIIVLTIPANIFGFNSQTFELREKLEFVVLFLVTVYHALVQGKSIDLSTRESFLKTKEISNLKDKSSTERKKNIAMLPLPDVITNGLQEGKILLLMPTVQFCLQTLSLSRFFRHLMFWHMTLRIGQKN